MWRFLLVFFCILCISCQSTVRYRAVKEGRHDSNRLEQFITEWMGTPYRYGGMNKNGVDCSGFVSILMKEIYGIRLPRTSSDQYKQGGKIAWNRLRKGDLVFFNIVPKRGVDHVGFFLGGDKFVHAATESGVTISNLNHEYYRKHYYGACRYLTK